MRDFKKGDVIINSGRFFTVHEVEYPILVCDNGKGKRRHLLSKYCNKYFLQRGMFVEITSGIYTVREVEIIEHDEVHIYLSYGWEDQEFFINSKEAAEEFVRYVPGEEIEIF